MLEWLAIILGSGGLIGAILAWRRYPSEVRLTDISGSEKLAVGADQMIGAASQLVQHYQSIISDHQQQLAELTARIQALEDRTKRDEETIHKLRNRIARLEAFLEREGYNPQEI